jgi:hypothetical protein
MFAPAELIRREIRASSGSLAIDRPIYPLPLPRIERESWIAGPECRAPREDRLSGARDYAM